MIFKESFIGEVSNLKQIFVLEIIPIFIIVISSIFFRFIDIIIFLLYISKINSFYLCLNRIECLTWSITNEIIEEKLIRNENNVFLVQYDELKLSNHYEIKNKNMIFILL